MLISGHSTISFLIAIVLVVTIEMPFSGAVRTWLAYLTPKVKGPSSPSAPIERKIDQDHYGGEMMKTHTASSNDDQKSIPAGTSKSSSAESSSRSSISNISDPPPYSDDGGDKKNGEDNKAFYNTQL